MITTVTLNPAIDKIVEINNLTLGQVHRVQNQVVALGGKSINVSRILTGLKCVTCAICFVGSDNFDEISVHAKADKIPLESIMVEGQTRTNVKIIEPDVEYRTTDINEIGFYISGAKLKEMSTLIKKKALKSDYVILSGSIPEGVPKSYYKTLTKELRILTRVVIDADGEILKNGIEGSPFMIKPNIHELESAVGMKLDTHEAIIDVCKKLIDDYEITYILVSMGEEGSLLVGKHIVLRAGILPVKVVSTVGAGDSMLAGMIYGLVKYADIEEEPRLKKSLAYGVAASSIAISTQNHLAFGEEELVERAKKVTIKKQ